MTTDRRDSGNRFAAQPDGLSRSPSATRGPGGSRLRGALLLLLAASLTGCTSWREYVQNGFKVGPNYCRPPAPVAPRWIEANDPRVSSAPTDAVAWWRAFNDPTLEMLIQTAYRQNLTVRAAAFRVLEARAQRDIIAGNLFPQTQQAYGAYSRNMTSLNTPFGAFTPQRFTSDWTLGARLAWELDFWGNFRRAIESADANLDASVESYDGALVLLLSEVAQSYVDLRTAEQRLQYLARNVVIQALPAKQLILTTAQGKTSPLEEAQVRSSYEQACSQVPPLEIARQQAANQLCILLGMPPGSLDAALENPLVAEALNDMHSIIDEDKFPNRGIREIVILAQKTADADRTIPKVDLGVVIGIPADLLRRRPDVRQAERVVAAQSAQIGVAEAALYPHISINGNIYIEAEKFSDLFSSRSLAGNVGPSFQWNILNYGRLVNNVRLQDAKFQELVATYQNTVLQANAEAENALVGFLNSQRQVYRLHLATEQAQKATGIMVGTRVPQELGGPGAGPGFNATQWVVVIQSKIVQEDTLAQAEGFVAQDLIQLYKALGGGWQIRLGEPLPQPPVAGAPPQAPPEPVPPGPVQPLQAPPVPAPPKPAPLRPAVKAAARPAETAAVEPSSLDAPPSEEQ